MTRQLRLSLLSCFLTVAFACNLAARPDSAKTLSPQECQKCHKSEVATWRATHHNASFGLGDDIPDAIEEENLLKEEHAETYGEVLGIEAFDEPDALCADCHVTEDRDGDLHGVSCESCHGAAVDWLKTHSKAPDGESTSGRETRMAEAVAAGMLRPSNLRAVAANCFTCHTIQSEELVNKTGHAAGSADFELVAWSQGEVRHNFLADESKNAVRSKEHLRRMYVIGKTLDLEFSLQAASKATGPGRYFDAMSARIVAADQALAALSGFVEIDAMRALLPRNGEEVKITPGDAARLKAIEDGVRAQGEKLASNDLADFSGVAVPTALRGSPSK